MGNICEEVWIQPGQGSNSARKWICSPIRNPNTKVTLRIMNCNRWSTLRPFAVQSLVLLLASWELETGVKDLFPIHQMERVYLELSKDATKCWECCYNSSPFWTRVSPVCGWDGLKKELSWESGCQSLFTVSRASETKKMRLRQLLTKLSVNQ